MTADIDDNIAGKLFGRTSKIRVRVNSEPPLPQLLAPFEWREAAAHSHCKKCGTVLEINAVLAHELSDKCNIVLPELLEGMYFEQDTCLLCSDDNTVIVLKRIMK